MESKITPTVEGGLLTAIAVILGLASTYLPILGLFVEFFCAVPIVILTVRQGIGKGTLSLVASFVILTMFIGPLFSIRIALSFGICGLILGYCVQMKYNAAKCFVATFVAAFLAQVISVLMLAFVMGINLMDTEISAVRESFEQSFQMYENIGVDKQAIAELRERVEPTLQLMGYLMPFLLAMMALVNAVTCYLTSKWIFAKLRLKFVESLPPFASWRFPKVFLYIVAFSAIGVYWGSTREWILLYTISVNVVFLSTGVGFIQGLSVLSAVADRFNVSKIFRRIFLIFVFLNMLLVTIITFTGLFDMIFDYRKKLDDRKTID